MAIKSGKTTILSSAPGVVPTKEVTVSGMTTSGVVLLTLAERDSPTDTRGQMEFYAVCESGKFTIYGENKELYSDTDIYWMADNDGTGADVVGLLDFKGDIDASSNPNYPVGIVGDSYVITVAGKVGGASGEDVTAGDFLICKVDNAGGDEATVGADWFVVEKNLNDTDDVPEGVSNLYYTDVRVSANSDVTANTTHISSDGTDHANVVTNDTHVAGDGSDHADVATNTTHISSDGTDHANVVTNDTHVAGDGSDHADVATNTTHVADVLIGHMSPIPQELTGPGAVDLITSTTLIVTTGIDALTLADGVEGQHKYIVMKTDVNDGTLTPTNLANGTTITFDDVGDSAHLLFTNSAWHFMGGTATLA